MTENVIIDYFMGTNSKIGPRQNTEHTVIHNYMYRLYSICQILCVLMAKVEKKILNDIYCYALE